MKLVALFALFAFAIGCSSSAAPPVEDSREPTKTESAKKDKAPTENDDQNDIAEKEAKRISLADAKKAFDAGEAVFVDTRAKTAFENEACKKRDQLALVRF